MSDDRRDSKGRGGSNPEPRKPKLRRPGEFLPANKDTDSSTTNNSVSILRPNAPEFVPRSNEPRTQPVSNLPTNPQMVCNGEFNDMACMSDVHAILCEITLNPGSFDKLTNVLVSRLSLKIQEDATINMVVHEIVEKAITEPNFRYNAARLCNFLSTYLFVHYNSYRFREILLQRCQNEYRMSDSLAQTPDGSARLIGFTMLLSDLFIQLELKMADGTTHKIASLGNAVLHLLDTLLKFPSKDHVKCVCQMMKLAGSSLEDFERLTNAGNAPLLDNCFMAMGNLVRNGSVERNSLDMLRNVMELRAIDWGRQPAVPDKVAGDSNIGALPTNFQPLENGESDEDMSIAHVRTIMYEITVNPGRFDTLATLLVDALNVTIKDDNTLNSVVHEIFEQAVTEQNFRYNGARLCDYLSNFLAPSFNTFGFRALLIQRCQLEYSMRNNLVQTPEKSARLVGFTMFMGELFIHMKIVSPDGTAHKVGPLCEAVLHLLETLLLHPTKELLKCACQMLKFTGAALDDFNRAANPGSPPTLNAIFATMEKLVRDGSIDKNAKDMLLNVMELRAIDWGRLPSNRDEAASDQSVPGTDPVLYGPDGIPISTEEALFLESNQYLYENTSLEDECNDFEFYSQNQNMWSTSDDVMDDEMSAAFEKFLLSNS